MMRISAMTLRSARAFTLAVAATSLFMPFSAAWAGTSITRTSTFSYDQTTGLLIKEVIEPALGASALETDTVPDPYGNKKTVTTTAADIGSRTTTTTYDSQGQFATTTSLPIGGLQTSQGTDGRFGIVTSSTDVNGLTTSTILDGFGRPTQVVHPDGTQDRISYTNCNGPCSYSGTIPSAYTITVQSLAKDGTTQIAPTVTTTYDALGRVLAQDKSAWNGANPIRVVTNYNSLGQVSQVSRPYIAVSNPSIQWTSYQYDLLNRVTSITNPDSSTAGFSFNGLSETDTNANGFAKTTVKNSQGEVIQVTDALGNSTSYQYDGFGNVTQVKDPAGNTTTYTYDAYGKNRTGMKDPDLGVWAYSYDSLGELTSQTDAKGQTVTISYDQLGRPTQRVEPDPTPNNSNGQFISTWTYDNATGKGLLLPALAQTTSASSPNYSRQYTYDSLSRQTQVILTINGTSYVINTSYDSNTGKVNATTYPDGMVVGTSFNASGYVTAEGLGAPGASPQNLTPYLTINQMDADLHETQVTAGNNVNTNRAYYPNNGRLQTIKAGLNNGSNAENLTYSYDSVGNVNSKVGVINTPSETFSLNESFAYDPINRILSTSTQNTSQNNPYGGTVSYNYDPTGNLTSKTDVGSYSYGAVQPHAVTAVTPTGSSTQMIYGYDGNGNQVSGPARTTSWTSFNMAQQITSAGKTISFTYDDQHRRISQTTPEGTTIYLSDAGISAEQFTNAGGAVEWHDYLPHSGDIVGLYWSSTSNGTTTTKTRYFHSDGLGSIVALTDENGNTVENDSYDSWGKRRYPFGIPDPVGSITSQTTRGFTSQEEVADAGLVNLNGRIYDPVIGRMISADPTTYKPYSTQGWNRYSYVNNNPLNRIDPTGFEGVTDDGSSDDSGGGGDYDNLKDSSVNISTYGNILVLHSDGSGDFGVTTWSGNSSSGASPLNLTIGWNDPGQLAGGQAAFSQAGSNNAAVSYGTGFLQNPDAGTSIGSTISGDLALGATKFAYAAYSTYSGAYLSLSAASSYAYNGLATAGSYAYNHPLAAAGTSLVGIGVGACVAIEPCGFTVAAATGAALGIGGEGLALSGAGAAISSQAVVGGTGVAAIGAIGYLAENNGASNNEVNSQVSQKQLRHTAGRPEYRGGGFMDSVDDAQKVLDAYHSGEAEILGQNQQGFPVVRVQGVTGTNVNVRAGYPNQPTNVFMIKGTSSPSVVPMNPNWVP